MPNCTKRSRDGSGDETEVARGGLDPAGQVGEPIVLPQILAGVDGDAVRPQIDHERHTCLVNQRGHGGGKLRCLRGRGGRVEGHPTEDDPPIRTVGELLVSDDVCLVSLGVRHRVVVLPGERHPAAGCLGRRHSGRQRPRTADIDVQAIAQRPRLGQLVERERRVSPQRVGQPAVAECSVAQYDVPERNHLGRVGGPDPQLHSLQHRRIGGQPQLVRSGRDRPRQLHLAGPADPDLDPTVTQVDLRQAGTVRGQFGDPADQRRAGGLRRRLEPGADARSKCPPFIGAGDGFVHVSNLSDQGSTGH